MNDGSENEMLIPQNIIVATGSKPRELEGLPFDGDKIVNSDHLLAMEELPSSIIIVGGGVIGIEWASCLNDLGVKVTVIEYGDRILPSEDVDISKELLKELKKRGIEVYANAELIPSSIDISDETVKGTVIINKEQKSMEADKILISIGRTGNIHELEWKILKFKLKTDLFK